MSSTTTSAGLPNGFKDMNDAADFWRYNIGANVIPADTRNKTTIIRWTEYQTNPIPEEQHNKWKQDSAFNDGIAIVMGKIWHNPGRLRPIH